MKKNWAKKICEQMTVEQKVGQLFMVSFFTWDLQELHLLRNKLREYFIGGVFHYTAHHQEMADFFSVLQAEAHVPLLVSSDFEMGAGWIIKEGVVFQRPMARGYFGTPDLEYTIAKIIAQQGRSAGANMSFSPVVDVNTNPLCPDVNTRAYSDNADKVTELAAGFVRGMQDNNMLATLKHFPGNGETIMDQHIGPAIIDVSKRNMHAVFLKPYKELIKTCDPAAVMVAHLEVPSLCSEIHPKTKRTVPASVSKEIITELLKKNMKFKGIVITDATNMGGINNLYSREEAAVKTIQAGSDMILDFYSDFERDYNAVLSAVLHNEISEERLNDAVMRVLTAKMKLNLHIDAGMPWDKNKREALFDKKEYEPLLQHISQKSITLLQNHEGIIPIKHDLTNKNVAVYSVFSPEKKVLQSQNSKVTPDVFTTELRNTGADVTEIDIVSDLSMDAITEIVHNAHTFDYIFLNFFIVPSFAIGTLMPNYNAMRLFFRGLLQENRNVIIHCFGDPYIVQHFASAPTIICCFDESEMSQKTALQAVLGKIPFSGKMPVNLPHIFSAGDGIETPEQ